MDGDQWRVLTLCYAFLQANQPQPLPASQKEDVESDDSDMEHDPSSGATAEDPDSSDDDMEVDMINRDIEDTLTVLFLVLVIWHVLQVPLMCISIYRMFIARRMWVRSRSHHFFHWWCKGVIDHEIWCEMFAMRPETAQRLVRIVAPLITTKNSRWRDALPVERKVLLTLLHMRTGESYRYIGSRFGVGASTANMIVGLVTKAIVVSMEGTYIRTPKNGLECRLVMEGFYAKKKFPNIVGVVDAVHFIIVAPDHSTGGYTNRKFSTSVSYQCMCDHQGLFTATFGPWPGSSNDKRIMRNSEVQEAGNAGAYSFPGTQSIIIADGGYTLKPWCIVPYQKPTGRQLTRSEKKFNFLLSSTRVIIEHSFGMLKGRFRALKKELDISLPRVKWYMPACMIMHNWCSVNKEQFKNAWREDIPEWRDSYVRQAQVRADLNDSDDGESDDEGQPHIVVPPPAVPYHVDVAGLAAAALAQAQAAHRAAVARARAAGDRCPRMPAPDHKHWRAGLHHHLFP